jgi:glucose-1-phosphatase
VRALLFDIGNVLVSFDFSLAASRFATQCSLSPEQIIAAISPFKDPLESGQISDEDFVAQSINAIGFKGDAAEFRRIWCDIFAINQPMADMLAAMPIDIPAYLLSNTSGLHQRFLFDAFPVFKRFNGGIYSHEARCMKPHAGIFEIAITQLGIDPSQTFYIDDLAPNIDTGKRLGFVSHLYDLNSHASLESELNSWLST